MILQIKHGGGSHFGGSHLKNQKIAISLLWIDQFLHATAMLIATYAVIVYLSVCLCVCVCVCHTPVLYQKAKRMIMQITPHDSPFTLVF